MIYIKKIRLWLLITAMILTLIPANISFAADQSPYQGSASVKAAGSESVSNALVFFEEPRDASSKSLLKVSDKNAVIGAFLIKPKGTEVKYITVNLYGPNGKRLKYYKDSAIGISPSSIETLVKYDVNRDLEITLEPNTEYKYVLSGSFEDSKGKAVYSEENEFFFKTIENASYRVQFNPSGGTVSQNSKTVINGHPYGLLPEAKRPGYVFLGWYTSLADDAEQINEDTEADLSADQNLYARWMAAESEPESYKVKFYTNGGTVAKDEITVVNGQKYGELPVPVKNGYVFTGWYTSQNGGTKIYSSSIVNLDATKRLYARWEEAAVSGPSYRITFDGNGGILDVPEKYVEKGQIYGNLPHPYKKGSLFEGWFTARQNGKEIKPGDTVNITKDKTLYAKWKDRKSVTNISLQIENPMITVNGAAEPIDEGGTVPFIRNDRTLLPVRAVVEAMGGEVDWNNDDRTVSMKIGDITLYLKIDDPKYWDSKGNTYVNDVAPIISNDRTMLPVRVIAEYFGADVQWDQSTKTVNIEY